MNPAILDVESPHAPSAPAPSHPSPSAAAFSGAESGPLYPGHRVLAAFPFFNEGPKLGAMASRLSPGLVDRFLGVNNASTDDGVTTLATHRIPVIDQPSGGVGSCLRAAIDYGRREGFDILVVMAGNDKDDPGQIPRLLAPLLQNQADYVQGSRFLAGGSSVRLPVFRHFSIKLLSIFYRLYTGQPCTDLTNGFRAYRLSLFDDPRINIHQDWLDTYEFEYYLHWKVRHCGYRVVEVPVTKTYPAAKHVPYTKIRALTGWWRMLRPFLFLALRIKQ